MIKISPEDKKLVDDLLARKGGKPLDEKITFLSRRKKEKVEAWDLSDPKLKEFSEQYKKYLDEDIRREEKRHEEDMEKLKRKYS